MSAADDHAELAALIRGVDAKARAMDAKWGVDRLPDIVDAELSAKFARQKLRWRAALEAAYDAKVITGPMMDAARSASAAMQRAWEALDRAAPKGPEDAPQVWDVRLHDGKLAAFVRTADDALRMPTGGRHAVVYTMDEVANIIAALPPAIASAKAAFPGATILPPVGAIEDEIPF